MLVMQSENSSRQNLAGCKFVSSMGIASCKVFLHIDNSSILVFSASLAPKMMAGWGVSSLQWQQSFTLVIMFESIGFVETRTFVHVI